jgi:hypothetical protein
VPVRPNMTELRCPRCGCRSFFRSKPGDKASDEVLPAAIANAKFLMICTGESYSTKVVDGGRLHEEWAIAIFGNWENVPSDQLRAVIGSMRDMDNWSTDPDHGPFHWKEDVGETDHIDFWRLT